MGLVHLQLQGAAPGDAGADVIVVVVGGIGLVFPVLVAGITGVLQVRTTGVEGGIAEQHVGTVGADQWGATDEGLPLAPYQLEGDVRTVDQAGVIAAVGDDEETGAGRIQVAQVESVAAALAMDVGPDHPATERCAVVALDVVAVTVAVAGVGANEGHRGVQVQGAYLQGRSVVVDGDRQGTISGVSIAVGDLVAEVEGDVVFGSAGRVHQRAQQVDGVGAAGSQIGQHHGHQIATDAADGQGVGSAVPGGSDVLAAQDAGPGEFDGFQPIGAGLKAQAAAGAGVSAGNIAGAAVDAAVEALVVEHVGSGHLAGRGAVVLEAHDATDAYRVHRHIAIAVGDGDHGPDQAAEVDTLIAAAGIRVVQRHVLGDADGAVLADGHGERRRSGALVVTVHAADDQTVFHIQADDLAVGGGEARIGAVTAVDFEAQHGGSAFVVLAGTCAGGADHGAGAGGVAFEIGTDVAHAGEQGHHLRIAGVVIKGVTLRRRGLGGVLQTGALVMGDTHALDPLNDCSRAIVLETDGAADAYLRSVHITITVGHGDHRADLAGQGHRVIGAAGVRVVERDVLGHADGAVLANGDGEGRCAGSRVSTGHAADDQAILQIQANGLPIGGG